MITLLAINIIEAKNWNIVNPLRNLAPFRFCKNFPLRMRLALQKPNKGKGKFQQNARDQGHYK